MNMERAELEEARRQLSEAAACLGRVMVLVKSVDEKVVIFNMLKMMCQLDYKLQELISKYETEAVMDILEEAMGNGNK